jgi:hypothetical protein
VADVVTLLASLNPDVFALYEVQGKEVFDELVSRMTRLSVPHHRGPQVQEILVGVRNGLTAFFTQKVEFQSGAGSMRPGALLTLTIAGERYPILFLHLASGPDPRGWGLRDDMLERAFKFRAVLQQSASGPAEARELSVSRRPEHDGLEYFFKAHNIKPEIELKKVDALAKKQKMRALTKNRPNTWSNGSGSAFKPSNLDHVVAADHLKFKPSAAPMCACSAGRGTERRRQDAGSNGSPTRHPVFRGAARLRAMAWFDNPWAEKRLRCCRGGGRAVCFVEAAIRPDMNSPRDPHTRLRRYFSGMQRSTPGLSSFALNLPGQRPACWATRAPRVYHHVSESGRGRGDALDGRDPDRVGVHARRHRL